MISANPELTEACEAMRDVVTVPASNSIYRVLSSEAYSKEGLNITRALVDELHAHPNRELWDVLNLASGGRVDPLIIAITTAGVMTDTTGRDSVCYDLFKHGCDVAGGFVEDPSFFFAWWGAPAGSDHKDPEVWRAANPGYGDLIDPEDFESSVKRTPENEFRTKRLNQWVAAQSAWFPAGVWMDCADATAKIDPGTQVVLGFDGSYKNDSTALVACTITEPRIIEVIGTWERQPEDDEDWIVPILDVEDAIRDACKKYRVREVACDPSRFVRSMQALAKERLPMVEYPQTAARMIPATSRFYEGVVNKELTHDGNVDLARHINNAVIKTSSRGSQISKESKWSARHIDLAVAAILAYDRACQLKKRGTGLISLNGLI